MTDSMIRNWITKPTQFWVVSFAGLIGSLASSPAACRAKTRTTTGFYLASFYFFFHFKVFDSASNYRPHLSNVSLFFFVDWFLFFPQESRDGAPVLIRNSREVLIDFILISRRRSSFLIQVEIFVFVVHLGGSFEGFESCF